MAPDFGQGMNPLNNVPYNPNPFYYAPKYQLIKVKGAAGANNFRMAPNSETLLVDETAPIVWFARTDSGGYLTVEPFDVSPHHEQPPVNVNALEERVKKLEDYYYVQQSNPTKPKKQRQPANEPAAGIVETGSTNV